MDALYIRRYVYHLYDQATVNGHTALFMAVAGVGLKSGAYTLAQCLRQEGRLSAERVAQHFAVLVHGPLGASASRADQREAPASHPQDPDDVPAEPRWLSVDRLARLAVSHRLDPEAQRILVASFGLESPVQGKAWASQQDVAERLGVGRDTVQQVLHRARDRWGRQPWMTALRDDMAVLQVSTTALQAQVQDLQARVVAARTTQAALEDIQAQLAQLSAAVQRVTVVDRR